MMGLPISVDRDAEIALALQNFEKSGNRQVAKVRYTHDAMIDVIIENPSVSQGELAKVFGYTQAWVSIVINSDAFQTRLEARKEQLVDPTIRLTLNERFNALVVRSLDVLQEKLSKDSDKIPDNLVLRAVELGSKALGVGGNAAPPAPPLDHLNVLADRLLALQGRVRAQPLEMIYDEGQESRQGQAAGAEPHSAGSPAKEGLGGPAPADSDQPHPAAESILPGPGGSDQAAVLT